MTRLFIAGATGLVGGHVLGLALADTRVTRVIAPTRRPLPPHPRLENPRLNLLMDEAEPDGWRAEGAICALGTTRATAGSASAFRAVDHDLVVAMARRLREAGVQRFALVSSVGANPRSRFLYTRTKGEVEEAIVSLGFPSSTILRPGFLDGERTEYRPLERYAGALLRLVAPLLPRAARPSPVSNVAAMLLEAAIAGAPGVHIIGSAELA